MVTVVAVVEADQAPAVMTTGGLTGIDVSLMSMMMCKEYLVKHLGR
jgi:hypothetical protein